MQDYNVVARDTNNKIDKLTEITNDVKVNQAKLQGKVETLQVIIGTLIILVFTPHSAS